MADRDPESTGAGIDGRVATKLGREKARRQQMLAKYGRREDGPSDPQVEHAVQLGLQRHIPSRDTRTLCLDRRSHAR